MKKAEFKAYVQELGLTLSDLQLTQFDEYHKLLAEWNEFMNLTGITDEEGVYEKHYYDSLLSIKDINYHGRFADVGSGAGFPGMVLKIAYPELEVVLIEPLNKRCKFLMEVVNKLGLEKIEIVNARSEDYAKENRESFDFVSARAVSNLNVLSELCVPLVKVGGEFVILRGADGIEEIENARKALKELGAEEKFIHSYNLLDGSTRIISSFVKTTKTKKTYPRNYGNIKKKPL